jgi:hypothetical protein
MAVLGSRQHMELFAASSAMAVPHEADLLEHVEGPVHGRWDRLGIGRATALYQLAGRNVPARPREH